MRDRLNGRCWPGVERRASDDGRLEKRTFGPASGMAATDPFR